MTGSSGASTAIGMSRQEYTLQELTSARVASQAENATATAETPPSVRCDRAVLDPYIHQLRHAAASGLSDSAMIAQHTRRDATNAEVAATDVGEMGRSQHPVAFELAETFGLNSKQRLAFYIFANGMLTKNPTPTRKHSAFT